MCPINRESISHFHCSNISASENSVHLERDGTSPNTTIAIIVRDPSNSSQETAGPQSPKKLGATQQPQQQQQQPVKQVNQNS